MFSLPFLHPGDYLAQTFPRPQMQLKYLASWQVKLVCSFEEYILKTFHSKDKIVPRLSITLSARVSVSSWILK